MHIDESYLCHTKHMNLWPRLDVVVRPVDIDLLEHWWRRWSRPGAQGKASAPILSLDASMFLRRGRLHESAPPSDARRVAC
jgi:hypothetical protein